MCNITVLTIVDRIGLFYSLSPFFNNTVPSVQFSFTTDPSWCLTKDTNKILILMRWCIKPDVVDTNLLQSLRAKYERIAFFHDDAGGGIPRLEVLPFVDLFYQKALFKDRDIYTRPLYGKELYSDYFHTKYGIVDPDSRERAVIKDKSQLDKLRLSWNIGIGEYPRTKWKQRIAVAVAKRTNPKIAGYFMKNSPLDFKKINQNKGKYTVHARLGLISRPSISYMREIILSKIQDNPAFITGMVSQKQFNYETAHSKIVLSPFGWGELCLRDFETVRGGALLLKPDMSHLETWPNVFIPNETYVSFDWDAEDLIEKAMWFLSHESERKRIVQNAAAQYAKDIDTMPLRFKNIIGEIKGGTIDE